MSLLSVQEGEQDTYNFADSVVYEFIETQEALVNSAKELAKERILAVDTENTAIDPHKGRPLLLQIGTAEKCYVYPAYMGLEWGPLKEILENKDILKVFFNAHYDYKWIYVHYNISVENIFCCQVAERLLTVGLPTAFKRSSLKAVALKYLGIEIKKEARSAFIDRDPIAAPITPSELAYSAADVVILPDIFFQQSLHLDQHGLTRVSELESEVLPCFAEMEIFGSLVDETKWRELLKETRARYDKIVKEIHKVFAPVVAQKNLFGLPTFNIRSTQQLLDNLSKLGFEVENTDEETIKKLKNKHPVFSLLLDYRGYEKILSAYGDKFLEKIHPKTGRIHAKFNQLQADTGRASSSEPNFQNVPAYDEDDPDSLDFRSCFKARPGYKLITADFSQQELRILADCSGDPVLCKAYTTVDENGKDIDIHTYTASVVFNIPYNKVGKKSRERRIAKTLNFLLVYGGGPQTLAESLEITELEAKKIIDDYFRRYAGIKSCLDRWSNETINNGFSETVSGRKRYMTLPPLDHPDFIKIKNSIKRKGKNNPVQGGGADVTKKAMVFVRNAIRLGGYDARILKVVHDELVVEVREDQAKTVASLMEQQMILGFSYYFKKIPMKVDVNIADTWEK